MDTTNNGEEHVHVKAEQEEEKEEEEEFHEDIQEQEDPQITDELHYDEEEEDNGEELVQSVTEETTEGDTIIVNGGSNDVLYQDPDLSLLDQDHHQHEAEVEAEEDQQSLMIGGPTLQISVVDHAHDDHHPLDVDMNVDVDVDDHDHDQAGPTLQIAFQENTDDHLPEIDDEEGEDDHHHPDQQQQQQHDEEIENEDKITPLPSPIIVHPQIVQLKQIKENDNDKDNTVDDVVGGDSIDTNSKNIKKRPRSESMEENKSKYDSKNLMIDNTNSIDDDELLMKVVYEEVMDDPKIIADLKLIKESTPKTELELALTSILNQKEQHISKLTTEIIKLKGFISKRKQTYKRKRKDEGAPTRALSAYNIFVQEKFAELAKKNDDALKSTDTNAQMRRVPPASLVKTTGTRWKALSEEEKSKYEEQAKSDRKRYDDQMAKYQPPDKQMNRKRNKTGYNMFFSAHVIHLKQTSNGVPSERGSVARYVGIAWKALSVEEKQYYEQEADKHNGMNPVDNKEEDGVEVDDDQHDDEVVGDDEGVVVTKGTSPEAAVAAATSFQQRSQAASQPQQLVQDPYAAHAAAAAAHYAGHEAAQAAYAAGGQHAADPRMHAHHAYYYAHQPHPAAHGYHYDYSEYYKQQQQQHQHAATSQQQQQQPQQGQNQGGGQQQQSRSSRQQQQQPYPYPTQQTTHGYGDYK